MYNFDNKGQVLKVTITENCFAKVKFAYGTDIVGTWTETEFRNAIMNKCDGYTLWEDDRIYNRDGKNNTNESKVRVKATAFIKREDGRAEVCMNGQWYLTSTIQNYFEAGGFFECETQNTIYSNIVA